MNQPRTISFWMNQTLPQACEAEGTYELIRSSPVTSWIKNDAVRAGPKT
jgi:hypothetical protein